MYEIGFILTSKRTAGALYGAIFPDFVHSITELLLTPSFSMTGVGGYNYQLYIEGYMSQFYRSFAYSLTFTRSVYQSDWTVIQNNLKNFWCIHLGESLLPTVCTSLTFTRSVYQSDWNVIQNNLKNFWCIHLGESILP